MTDFVRDRGRPRNPNTAAYPWHEIAENWVSAKHWAPYRKHGAGPSVGDTCLAVLRSGFFNFLIRTRSGATRRFDPPV